MIIDYDKNPNLSVDQKLQSLGRDFVVDKGISNGEVGELFGSVAATLIALKA